MSESAREGLIKISIRAISTSSDVDTPGSPQNLAEEWIINLDPLYVCPDDPSLGQRYTMAVFYYSTRGDRWTQCSAPSDFQNQTAVAEANAACNIVVSEGGSDAWLTPSAVCEWGGLSCTNSSVVRIDFGKPLVEELENGHGSL